VSYGEALDIIAHGEAGWVELVVAVGPPKELHTAITVNSYDRVRRGKSTGAPQIEVGAEIGLAKLRNRPPDLSDTDPAAGRDEEREQSVIRKTKGGSIGGRIRKTTRTRLSGDGSRLVEESTATFDGGITGMGDCGRKSRDRTGGSMPLHDDYSDDSSS
jgi:hypothetical protein